MLESAHPGSLGIGGYNIPHGIIRTISNRETPGREGELEIKVKRRKTTLNKIWGHRQ